MYLYYLGSLQISSERTHLSIMISEKASMQAIIWKSASLLILYLNQLFPQQCAVLYSNWIVWQLLFLKKLSYGTLIPSVTPLVCGVHTKKTWGLTELFSLEENSELTFLRNRNKNLTSEKIEQRPEAITLPGYFFCCPTCRTIALGGCIKHYTRLCRNPLEILQMAADITSSFSKI